MGQNINFEQAISNIANIASSFVNSIQTNQTEEPLFDEQFADTAQNALEFVSVLGDVSSSSGDNSIQTAVNLAGSVSNIISTVLGGLNILRS